MPPRYKKIADAALEGEFTLQGVTAKQKKRPDGGFDWDWRGPKGDPEWAWFFNRLSWLSHCWRAYKRTGREAYFMAITDALEDWIGANPPPGRFNFRAAWRPLEVARRLLYVFLPYWRDWMEVRLWPRELTGKFKRTLRDHGRQLRKHHALGGNHLITEMRGLLTLAVEVPEISGGSDWFDYSLARLDRSYQRQVYPDGVHKELSSHYHRIIAQNFCSIQTLLETHSGNEALTRRWSERVEGLWSYMRQVMTPSGKNPLNNDSDLEDFQKILKRWAPRDVLKQPQTSCHFPWAGQTVFRGAGKPHWAFFDHGPLGTDHEHHDFNNFLLSVDSADFLVDSGRHTYEPGPWRDYFSGPRAHNILLLDGSACQQFGREAKAPITGQGVYREKGNVIEAEGKSYFDRPVVGRFGDWRRVVRYEVDQLWEVRDHVVCFGERRVETFWHFHPECVLKGDPLGPEGLSVFRAGLVLKVTLEVEARAHCAIETVKGQKRPRIQGWYSYAFNRKRPAPVLVLKQTAYGVLVNRWSFACGASG